MTHRTYLITATPTEGPALHARCTCADLFTAQCVGQALLGDGVVGSVRVRRIAGEIA